MQLYILKENKPYKEVKLEGINGIYKYKSERIESGSYSFYVVTEGKNFSVVYSHTAPFVNIFEAYLEENSRPKPITGFQKNIDISIEIDMNQRKFRITKTKFTKFVTKFSKKIDKIAVAGTFNNWQADYSSCTIKSDTEVETVLDLHNGYYEYKYIINGVWEEGNNRRLTVGENGRLFEEGKLGTGKFVYEPLDKADNIRAIAYDINKISDIEYEFTLRTQLHDVQRVYICLKNKKTKLEIIKELERFSDYTNHFDYFKRIVSFDNENFEEDLVFILEDANKKAYFDGNDLFFEKKEENISLNKNTITNFFYIPAWTKEAIWYNIFPDRYYNADPYNDPIFNELGPESFSINRLHEYKFINSYKWKLNNIQLAKFDRNRWTSDFSDKTNWEKIAEQDQAYEFKYARMYGGDLLGIKEKIPYMKELGINAVWLNPVFFSYQNHKYGSNDFRHISPDFGTIRTTGEKHGVYICDTQKTYIDVLGKNAKHNSELKLLDVQLVGKNKGKNGYLETEDPKTWVWTESDLIMVDLIKEFHKNGIRVIFDGVFNHSSERHWSFELALAQGKDSKYAKWYRHIDFTNYKPITDDMTEEEAYKTLIYNKNNIDYTCWAGFRTLPEFDTFNIDYKEYIFNIVTKWMLGPDGVASDDYTYDDGIDGWRLDVPNCLENQDFWKEFRQVVKGCKKDSYITGEIWVNAGEDVSKGEKFDAVMNYEWLKAVIGYFINQSKFGGVCYKLKASDFFNELREKRTWYPYQAIQAMQNLNGSHDTDRLYSRIVNDRIGRDIEEGKQLEKGYNGIRPDIASNYHPNTTIDWLHSEIKPKQILKLISVFQMTYIGAPMLYYGDEVGMWGATDPYCRKPMLWDEYMYDDEKNPSYINKGEVYKQEPDLELLAWYKKIIAIRKNNKVLVYGKFKEILADDEKDIIIYERYDKKTSIICVINNSFESQKVTFKTYHMNKEFLDLLTNNKIKTKTEGEMCIQINPKSAMILKLNKEMNI